MTSSPIPRHAAPPPGEKEFWQLPTAFCLSCLHHRNFKAVPVEPTSDEMYPYVCPRHGHLLFSMVDLESCQEGIPNE